MKKENLQNAAPIALAGLSNFGGVEILEIDHDEERIFYRLYNGKVQYAKIHDGENQYFNTRLGRIFLSDCIRVA